MVLQSAELGMATPFWELRGQTEEEMRAEFADYADLGVKMVRFDFYWGQVERVEGGGYNWGELDKLVNTASEYGIEVIGLLTGNTNWTSSGITDPADHIAFGDFAKAAAEHFEGRVDTWEIWNEQNLHGIHPDDYAELLKEAYNGIKTVNSDNIVITGGLASVPSTTGDMWGAVEYIEKMYEAGAGGHFDALGFHPYTYPLMPEDGQSYNGWQIMEDGVRDTMVANGDGDLQVWITELGAPTAGSNNPVTQSDQALILEQAMTLANSNDWMGPVLWYSYQDRGGASSDSENWFGLIGPNGEKKDAYYAFQNMASEYNSLGNQTSETPIVPDVEPLPDEENGTDADTNGSKTFVINDLEGPNEIADFSVGDKLDLSAINAISSQSGYQEFTFIGGDWLSAAGDLGVYQDTVNEKTYVQAELDGDGSFDLNVVLAGLHDLTAEDFIMDTSEVPQSVEQQDAVVESEPMSGDSERKTFVVDGNSSVDQITGFSEGDMLDLRSIDGNSLLDGQQGLNFIGGNWLSEAGDLGVYQDTANSKTYVQAELDGDGSFDLNVVLVGLHDLTAEDFVMDNLEAPQSVEQQDTIVESEPMSGDSEGKIFVVDGNSSVDRITGFSEGDMLDLRSIDGNSLLDGQQGLNFIGGDWLSEAGHLGVYQDTQNNKTHVQAELNGDGGYDLDLILDGVHLLTESDFLLPVEEFL